VSVEVPVCRNEVRKSSRCSSKSGKFAQVRDEVYDVVYSSRYTVDEVYGTSYAVKKTLNVRRSSSLDEKYLQFYLQVIFSLLVVFTTNYRP